MTLDHACRALVLSQSGEDCFDGLEPEAQEVVRENMRAVLQAIKEPSEAMLDAAWACALAEDAAGVWRDMIDALLAQPLSGGE
jgi:hypothetical protein